MAEITIYIVRVEAEVRVQATTEEEAKQLALAHFSQSPQSYLTISSQVQVVTADP